MSALDAMLQASKRVQYEKKDPGADSEEKRRATSRRTLQSSEVPCCQTPVVSPPDELRMCLHYALSMCNVVF